MVVKNPYLAMEPGTIARVIKDFLTTNEGELCINKDEYVQVRALLAS